MTEATAGGPTTEAAGESTMGFSLPAWAAPPSWMIGASTRLMDCWCPQREWIRMAPLAFSAKHYRVGLGAGEGAAVRSRRFGSDAGAGALACPGAFFDARYCGGNNIAHAIVDGAIPALACQRLAESVSPGMPVTVVTPAATAAYVKAVYEILGFEVLATDRAVHGQRLRSDFEVQASVGLAGVLLPPSLAARLDEGGSAWPRRVYFARRGAREILNGAAIEGLLKGEGFETVYPERLPVLEQFRCLWHAEEVVGVHGAGLAALLLRAAMPGPRPLRLVEVFGPGYIVTLYRHVVAALGGEWIGVRGQVTPEVVRDLEVRQGRGLFRRSRRALDGILPGRFLPLEPSWERHHQATPVTIDPESLVEALGAIRGGWAAPPARPMDYGEVGLGRWES